LSHIPGEARDILMPMSETAESARTESICIACDARCEPLFIKSDFEIVRCVDCGLGTVVPMPTPVQLADFYANAYYQHDPNSSDQTGYHSDYRELEAGLKRMYRQFLSRIERQANGRPFDRVLDVGCAYGFFLDTVEECYAPSELVGVDVSPEAEEQASLKGRTFHAGFVEDVDLPDAHFDLVFMGDALEHVHDPQRVADKLVRVLAPGGTLVLTTVDFGSWLARWLGVKWRLLTPPEHLFFWTRDSLKRLFHDRGLTGSVGNYWLYYPKSYVYQRTRQQFGFAPRFLSLVPGNLIPIPSFDAMVGLFHKPVGVEPAVESSGREPSAGPGNEPSAGSGNEPSAGSGNEPSAGQGPSQ
jgi:SAM-dependent methyltransferase